MTAAAIGALAALAGAAVSAWLAYVFKLRDLGREGEAAQRLLEHGLIRAEQVLAAALPPVPWHEGSKEGALDLSRYENDRDLLKTPALALAPDWDWALGVAAWEAYGDRLARYLGGHLAAEVGNAVDQIRALRTWIRSEQLQNEHKRPNAEHLLRTIRTAQAARLQLTQAEDRRRGAQRIRFVAAVFGAVAISVFALIELDSAHLSGAEVAGEVAALVTGDEGKAAVQTCDSLRTGVWDCTVVTEGCPRASTASTSAPCSIEVDARVETDDDNFVVASAVMRELDAAATKPAQPTRFQRIVGWFGRIGAD